MKERLEYKLLMWGWETRPLLVIREDLKLWFGLQIQMFKWWQVWAMGLSCITVRCNGSP